MHPAPVGEHIVAFVQTPAVHSAEQHSVFAMHGAPLGEHIGGAVQTPEEHVSPAQQSTLVMHAVPTAPQVVSPWKSLVTLAAPLWRKITVTLVTTPGLSVAGVGSLTQVGMVMGVTAAHMPGNAASVKITLPDGKPLSVSVVALPGARSNDRVTVRLPLTVI
jgi:hypothetical protein